VRGLLSSDIIEINRLHKKCKYAAYLELCYVLVLALTLSKNNSEVLRNNVIDHMKQVRFISIMSDDSRPLTDQEAILLRKVLGMVVMVTTPKIKSHNFFKPIFLAEAFLRRFLKKGI
jgi:hypothetical protein